MRMPSRAGMELLTATARDAVDTAPRSSAFSQENFMGDLLLTPASLWERTGFLS